MLSILNFFNPSASDVQWSAAAVFGREPPTRLQLVCSQPCCFVPGLEQVMSAADGRSQLPHLYLNFNSAVEVGGVATMALLQGTPVSCAVAIGSVWVNSSR